MRLPQYVGYDQDGNRTGYHYSPRGIVAPSGMRIADASTKSVADLNAQGLYPCVPPAETPDLTIKRITGFVDELQGDRSQLSWVVVDLTAEEIAQKVEQAKADALTAVDQTAATLGESVTDGLPAIRAAEYELVAEEAEALLAEADPDNPQGIYETLQADLEAGTINPATGQPVQTLKEAALVVVATREAWRKQALVAIRRARLTGKAAVRAATTVQDVQDVKQAINWPEFGA